MANQIKIKGTVLVSFRNNKIIIHNNNKILQEIIINDKQHDEIKKIIDIDKFNEQCGVMVIPDKFNPNYTECRISHALLHLHTGYSLLDGAIKSKDLSKKLSDETNNIKISVNSNFALVFTEYPQICACTDHGNMFGTYEFNGSLLSNGIVPIIGIETYCMSISNNKKESHHLVLLAKNETGYKNLCKIIKQAELNFYIHPLITWDLLEKYHDGIVCLSACLAGEIPSAIVNRDIDKAYELAENFQSIFGEDFYLEVQNHELQEELLVANVLRKIGKELNIKIVCTTDSHYLNSDYNIAHDTLLCISTKKKLSDPDRFKFNGEHYHVPTNKEFELWFDFMPESMAAQNEIASKCNFRYYKKPITMPKFDTGKYTPSELFEKQCWDGFNDRFKNKEIDINKYKERLQHEISVIKNMQFETYFLIVAEFINWAKQKDIAIGPGRGSAVGSLAAYCMKITNLDPIPYNLLFERFLNPERVSWPDIDVDIEDERRGEVIAHVKKEYGEDCVSRIITFGTLSARMVIRDVGRVLDFPNSVIDKIAKSIPQKPGITIDQAKKESENFKKYCNDPQYKELIYIAEALEGLPRNKSQHACGLIISARPVDEFVPEVLLKDSYTKGQTWTTGFNKNEIEDFGLLKMDFLGLRNMGIIKKCEKILKFDAENIPLNDPYVYKFISSGNTEGIFQIESSGMKGLMKEMFFDISTKINKLEHKYKCKGFENKNKNPIFHHELEILGQECFERLVAAISLYRPGPMDSIPQYIEGLKNPESIHYDTKELKDILGNTYGCLVYQEQVQQACRKLAGFSLGRSDIIRRGMAKKHPEVIAKEEKVFFNGNKDAVQKGEDKVYVPGCKNNGISDEAAHIIWDKMKKFAAYAFNKSHAAGYAVISIQTAWLKYYHLTDFWCITINSIAKDLDKLKRYINCAKFDGINFLPPDVNESDLFYTVKDNNVIRMGLFPLKNVGKSAVDLIDERNNNGKYKDYNDFIDRVLPGKKIYEALIYSGALDCFDGTRRSKKVVEDNINKIKDIKNGKKNIWFKYPKATQILLDLNKIILPDMPEIPEEFKVEKEYEIAGMYISSHPLNKYEYQLTTIKHYDICDLNQSDNGFDDVEESDVIIEDDQKEVTVCGIIKGLETKFTKRGNMYIAHLEDKTGQIRITIFPNLAKTVCDKVHENSPVIIHGTWKSDDYGISIIADSLTSLQDLKISSTKCYTLYVDKAHINKLIPEIDKCSSDDPNDPLVKIILDEKTFFIKKDKKGKRAIIPNKNNLINLIRIKDNFSTFGKLSTFVKKIER